MTNKERKTGCGFQTALIAAAAIGVLVALLPLSMGLFYGARTIHDLLTENRRLKEAISRLTQEDQIGYAKVVSQERREGRLMTTLLFIETARGNPAERVLEKQFTIEGDVVHFDALIVKFGTQLVMDGRERALYLWRRVYGETQTPASGHAIERPGAEPRRYADLLGKLRVKEREMFWSAVWDLANDPDRLRRYGITAVYGNAVYAQLRPGFIYVLKINPTGGVYPETVPDM